MRRLLVIATTLALFTVWADDKANTEPKKKSGGMMRPKASPEMKDLQSMAGTWKTTDVYEKVEGISPGGEGASTETMTLGPGGYSLVMRIKSASGPMGAFNAIGILTWDAGAKEYKMAWVDNMMPGLVLETGQKEGDDIVMSGEVKMGGKTYKTRDVISDRTPTSYTMTSYMDDSTGEKKMMTVKATKEEAASKPASKSSK